MTRVLWRRALLAGAMVLGLAAAFPDAAPAQGQYPDRPIKIIVPFLAGGATDLTARLLAQHMGESLGQTVVVENRPGAGSILGNNAVAKADPDGYTILLASSSIFAVPALYKSVPYDLEKDLAPIAEVAGGPNIIVADPKSGIGGLADMIARAKADPDKLNYASPGVGTTPQLAMELLKLRAGIKITHVVYKGAAGAMQALSAGTVPLGSMALSNFEPAVKAGTYKGLAVTSAKRWRNLPDVPTVEESGFPDFDYDTIFALFAPAATPKDILDRLTKEALAALKKPQVRERIESSGMAVLARGPDALKARIAKEVPTYKEIVSKAGIPVN
ncbi:MAG TPA: tripartite tricarboxylate transporter substrate binding protein [Xanthobacteraceae bacterium]|nr:tripartite tricarboxylate transporter substrate binding protein [Xanthobacteraceae bacterium]